jgi:hypothetical protein
MTSPSKSKEQGSPSSPSLELSLSPSKTPVTKSKKPFVHKAYTTDEETSTDTDQEDDDDDDDDDETHKYLNFQDIQALLGSTPMKNKDDPVWVNMRIMTGRELIERCLKSNQNYLNNDHIAHSRTGPPPSARTLLKNNLANFKTNIGKHWVFKKKTKERRPK